MEIYETESTSTSTGAIPLLSPNSDMEWWEYDLQLAAELGKALLERNQELESQLQEAEVLSREQQAENQFLSQKLATLRSLNESRMKMYEQVGGKSKLSRNCMKSTWMGHGVCRQSARSLANSRARGKEKDQ